MSKTIIWSCVVAAVAVVGPSVPSWAVSFGGAQCWEPLDGGGWRVNLFVQFETACLSPNIWAATAPTSTVAASTETTETMGSCSVEVSYNSATGELTGLTASRETTGGNGAADVAGVTLVYDTDGEYWYVLSGQVTAPLSVANECGVESVTVADNSPSIGGARSGVSFVETAGGAETFIGGVFPDGVDLELTAQPASGAANEFTITATFGEAVTDFVASDVSVTNGLVTQFDGSGAEYTFVVEPTEDGEVSVEIAADAATADSDSDLKSVAASLTLTGDVTAPSGYTVELDQDTINSDNEETVSFTFAGAEVGATYDYTISSSGGDTDVTGSGTIEAATDQITGIDVSGLEDGTLTLSVALTDAAGNEGSAETDTATKDATAPTGHSVSFTQSGVNADNETAIGFTISDAEEVAYSYTISSNGGGDNVTGSGTISGGTAEVTGLDLSGLEDGTLTLSVVLTDVAGNAATAEEDTVSKDGVAPDAPDAPTLADSSNSGSTTDTLTNDTTATIEGTAEENATVTVYVGETEAGTATADSSGDWSFTFDEGDLASGTNSITVTATDAAGNTSQASNALVITLDTGAPTVTLTGPTDVVTEDFTVTFTFSESVNEFTADDVTVTNGTKGTFSGSGTTYTLVVSPDLGTTVSISVGADAAEDDAGNGNTASDVFEVSAGSPASEFERYEEEIRAVIVDEAARSLTSTIAANQRMTRDARTRFIQSAEGADDNAGLVSRNNVAFDVDGTFAVNDTTVSTSGEFFQQTGNYEGTQRRLFFGDFDVQHDGDTGSTTATLTGRVAWEQMVSDRTMLGYFIGGELAYSNIDGEFEGDQDRIGLTVGGYLVHQLAEQVYFDGFLTFGAGRNNLEMANDVLALTSDYTTQTATIGAALSGAYDYGSYEFRPELAFSYGYTWIGTVDFTGRAYGLVDNTLSLDAGDVSIANLTLRPEVVWALDGATLAESSSRFSFAPRLICERVEAAGAVREDCGGGAEIGLTSLSTDGLTEFNVRVLADRVGSSTRSGLELGIQHRF